MDEKDFELLSILNETRNITRASEQLYMTQSALSKRIKSIEKDLGIELMIRSRQGIRFTPAGETVLSYSSSAAKAMEQMRQNLDSIQNEICGTLNIGVSINFAQYSLPDILASYHRKYPKVNLQITTGQSRSLYKQMADGSLDLAILRGDYPWDGVQFLLSQENICLVYNREYQHTPLSSLLHIGHRTDITQSSLIARWMREHNLDPNSNGFCVDSITTCMEMVKRGLGWALLPEIALQNYDGCIIPCIFENGEPFTRRTSLLCQREAMELPQISAFIDLLRSTRQGGIHL